MQSPVYFRNNVFDLVWNRFAGSSN